MVLRCSLAALAWWVVVWLGWAFVVADWTWPLEIMDWDAAGRGFFLVEMALSTFCAAFPVVILWRER